MSRTLKLVSLIAVLAVAAAFFGSRVDRTEAVPPSPPAPVAGTYNMDVLAQAVAPLGGNFTAQATIRYDAASAVSPCNGVPGEYGCYQAAQWKVVFDDSIIITSTAAITKVGAAPGACSSEAVTLGAEDFALLGCLDLAGANLSYQGPVWNIPFTCVGPGISPLFLKTTDTPVRTFVNDGASNQPLTTFGAPGDPDFGVAVGQVACIPTADLVTTKTAPLGAVAAAGGTPIQYQVNVDNVAQTPPIVSVAATSIALVDDMPDQLAFVSATWDADADGDSVNEILAQACLFFAAFPNPFPVGPAVITNLVFCPVAPPGGIAVGGSATATINATIPENACNQTLINTGFAASSDDPPMPGPQVADPDLLDGVALTDDNFDIAVTQVADCPITISKAGPAAGATGNADDYDLTVTAAGPSVATNVVVTDVVPAGLTVTGATASGGGVCVEAPANTVTCTWAVMAPGVYTVDIDFTEDAPGAYCNTASVSWTRGVDGDGDGLVDEDPVDGADNDGDTLVDEDAGPNTSTANSNQHCFTVIPPFNGLVKGVDGQVPGQGEDTIEVNLWLCIDQADDDIDNDGNSTVDDEPATCDDNGEGSLEIEELIFTREDCDTRNDDDDLDGEPVSNDPNSPGYRPECPAPNLSDYTTDTDGDGNGNVDKNGGELPEGLGAFEFQLKFDHKVFDITITTPCTNGVDDDADTVVDEATECTWNNGRNVNCSMTIISENDIRFGCVTTGTGLGLPQAAGQVGAVITVTPEADLVFRIRPGKDNGVVRRLLDENCEVADIFGDIFPVTNAGLTPDCTDIDITVRRLEGDLDTDCDVDVLDSQRIAFRYGSFFGQLLYDTFYDMEPFVTPDFDIDIKDLQFVFGRIGSNCDAPIPNNQNPLPANGVGQP